MRKDSGYDDLSKKDIWKNMERDSEHWEYDKVIEYTRENPDALIEYHNRIPRYYNLQVGVWMTMRLMRLSMVIALLRLHDNLLFRK